MIVTEFTVHGLPAPQGSKRHVGRGIMIESSKNVKPWREAVKHAALDAIDGNSPVEGPIRLSIVFWMPRPKSHYGTGRNASVLKSSAPFWCARTPDLSKLVRSTEDALTDAGVWRDDAQVVQLKVTKVYTENAPGATVTVTLLPGGAS